MTPEQIAAHNSKVIKLIYWAMRAMMIVNILFLGLAGGFFIACISNVFKGNWLYAVGFAILTLGFIFRHIPNARLRRQELLKLMAKFEQYAAAHPRPAAKWKSE
jgi:fibrillarin-like rRNA methylase